MGQNTKRIENIIRSELEVNVLHIKNVSNREHADYEVYMVATDNGDVMVRIPRDDPNRKKLKVHAWASQQWLKRGIPVPKVLAIGDGYLIEKRIDGVDMAKADLSVSQQRDVMHQLGEYLQKMHQVKTTGFGEFVKDGVGKEKTWKEVVDPIFSEQIIAIRKSKLLSEKFIDQIKKIYNASTDVLDFNDPRLIHADLCPDNIMVEAGRLSGIIDLADAMSGDPMCDLATVHRENFKINLSKNLFESYGEVDLRKVEFYALVESVWYTHFHSKIFKKESELKKNIASVEYHFGNLNRY